MGDTRTVLVEDVLDYREGPGILAKDFRADGVPLIRLAGVRAGSTILAGCNFLDPGMVERKWKHFQLEEGDVLLSTSASLGEVKTVDQLGVGAIPYTGLIRFRPRTEAVHPAFIRLALTSTSFKQQIEAMGVGSVMKHFGPMHLRKMSIDLPPLAIQVAISEVISTLDDKVAFNARAVVTTEQLANSLHDRLMTRSVELARLGDLLTLEYGKSLPSTERNVGEVKVFGSGGVVGEHSEALVRGPGVVVGRKGSIGTVYWSEGDFFPIDTTFYVRPAKNSYSLIFCYHVLKSIDWSWMNSDSAVPGLNRNSAHALRIGLPQQAAIDSFTQSATPLFLRLGALQRENTTLAALRDTLLPALMSGRLHVRDAEKLVEDAT